MEKGVCPSAQLTRRFGGES